MSLVNALHRYLQRAAINNRKPVIVQVGTSTKYRINRQPDDWPDVVLPPLPRWLTNEQVETLVKRVADAGTGHDPTAFEVAVCDAFAALGFKAQHFGGHGAPDGLIDAPLGVAGYRVMLECKTAAPGGIVSNPSAAEAAKFREAYHAQHGVLIGPNFQGDNNLENEMRVHEVSLWTVPDLQRCLREQIGPDEIRPAFRTGHAQDAVADILWERDHGRRKRQGVLEQLIHRCLWEAQVTLAGNVPPERAPAVDEDAILLLVDAELTHEGVIGGTTREEVRAALNALIARADVRLESDPVRTIARRPL